MGPESYSISMSMPEEFDFDDMGQQSKGENGITWAISGGGWRCMAATNAYAQILARVGLLGGKDDDDEGDFAMARSQSKSKQRGKARKENKNNIRTIAATSGSSWFLSQLSYSRNYYEEVINGTPDSLGDFMLKWMNAYASTQVYVCANLITCFFIYKLFNYIETHYYKPISAFDRKTLTLHVTKLDLGKTFVLHWTKKMQGDLLF